MANKRRGHGEGSIYQRKDGRYTASISLGNRKRKSFYGKTRKEVQDKLKAALHEQQQGTLVTARQQTVKQFLEGWLENTCRPIVRPLTYLQYRSVIKVHLMPILGHVSLQKLTPEMVRGLYRRRLDEGYKPRTIGSMRGVLHRALEDAVKDGLVARNVASLAKAPRIERRDMQQVLTVEEAKKLLDVARDASLDVLLLVALTAGMRRGELLALQWSDVDFGNGTLFVHRTVARVTGRGLVVGEPKSKSGRRRIVLPLVAVDALKEHRVRQQEMKLAAGSDWQDGDIVFCRKNGTFFEPNTMGEKLDRLLVQAGFPHMRFHDLRHSAATILLAAGVHPKIVQERLGHSSVAITLDVYSHVLPSMQQETAKKIDDLFR